MITLMARLLLLTVSVFSLTLSSARGNSKYHYYGIRVKPDSPLNRLQEDTQYMAMRQQPVHQKQRSELSPCNLTFLPFSVLLSIFLLSLSFKTQLTYVHVLLSPLSSGLNPCRRWMVCLTVCVGALRIVAALQSSRWQLRANITSST